MVFPQENNGRKYGSHDIHRHHSSALNYYLGHQGNEPLLFLNPDSLTSRFLWHIGGSLCNNLVFDFMPSLTQVGEQRADMTSHVCAKSLQLCPTLCSCMDCTCQAPLSVGILQARTLEWVATSFSRVFS